MYICFTPKTVHSLWATVSIKKYFSVTKQQEEDWESVHKFEVHVLQHIPPESMYLTGLHGQNQIQPAIVKTFIMPWLSIIASSTDCSFVNYICFINRYKGCFKIIWSRLHIFSSNSKHLFFQFISHSPTTIEQGSSIKEIFFLLFCDQQNGQFITGFNLI
jgi:hypothetical protein